MSSGLLSMSSRMAAIVSVFSGRSVSRGFPVTTENEVRPDGIPSSLQWKAASMAPSSVLKVVWGGTDRRRLTTGLDVLRRVT